MRFLWVDKGSDANLVKGAKHGMTGYFFDMTDPLLPARIDKVLSAGQQVGMYMAQNWDPFVGKTPEEVAQIVFDRWASLGLPNVRVQFDIENHDPDLVIRELEAFRALAPKASLSWTMEGRQGGWMTPEFVARVIAAKCRVVPQCYIGDMYPQDTLYVWKDMIKAGFPDSLISPFYDAKLLPVGWDGYAFTQGRLPA